LAKNSCGNALAGKMQVHEPPHVIAHLYRFTRYSTEMLTLRMGGLLETDV
jgi:hypothetical protein